MWALLWVYGSAGRRGIQEEAEESTAEQAQEQTKEQTNQAGDSDALVIAEQGIFSAGGTVVTSDGTFDVENYYTSREGSSSHVDHANIFYQIPEEETGMRWRLVAELLHQKNKKMV